MSNSGAVTLGDIADELPMLEVACSRCERHGRLSVARLIEQHGEDAKLTNLYPFRLTVCAPETRNPGQTPIEKYLIGVCPGFSASAAHTPSP